MCLIFNEKRISDSNTYIERGTGRCYCLCQRAFNSIHYLFYGKSDKNHNNKEKNKYLIDYALEKFNRTLSYTHH